MKFVDEARIFVQAGDGGQGCESFYKDKFMRYPRPDGGDGGKGGDVVVEATKSIQTLLDFKFNQHHKAQSGGHASSKGKKGKNGKDCVLRVPVGTLVRDGETNLLIKDLASDHQRRPRKVNGAL
jgi:GTP-binding protein